MSEAIQGLQPALVWKYFAEISKIPRGSKNEKRIAAYVMDTAKKEAKEQGLKEGKWLERINLAKAMLQDGLTIERVMKITGLSEKDISK